MPLHPQAKAFIALMAEQNAPTWDELPPVKSREIFSSFTSAFGVGPELPLVENRSIANGVAIRVYRPSTDPGLPVVMYFHGGGWVLGNLDTHDTLCRRLAQASGFVVISVDYRLAPEHKYPAAFDDCFAATAYVAEHSDEFGIDVNHVVVAGDSAGGNLAAAVALKSRDQQGPAIKSQLLIYPVIEPNFSSESYLAFETDHGLTRKTMQWFWRQYVDDSSADLVYVEVTRADLANLPRTHVVTAEYDVLRDEGERFASRLVAAGVPTTVKRYEGMLHGFIHFSALFDVGMAALGELADVLRADLDPDYS